MLFKVVVSEQTVCQRSLSQIEKSIELAGAAGSTRLFGYRIRGPGRDHAAETMADGEMRRKSSLNSPIRINFLM